MLVSWVGSVVLQRRESLGTGSEETLGTQVEDSSVVCILVDKPGQTVCKYNLLVCVRVLLLRGFHT